METSKVILSKQFSLMGRDYWRGLIVAGITAALTIFQASLDAGKFEFDLKRIGMAFVAGGVGYLLKNLVIEPTKIISTPIPEAKAERVQEVIVDSLNEETNIVAETDPK